MKKSQVAFLRFVVTSTVIGLCNLCIAQMQNNNVELVGQLPLPDQGGPIILNDIWGYVDEQGTEYALVGTYTGLSIISLADPSNPEEIFFVSGFPSIWRDIKTYQDIAYVSNDDGEGLQLVDLSDLPNSIRVKDTIISGVTQTHNLWQADGFLYMVGINQFNGGMLILSLDDDPWNPDLVGIYDRAYVHDVYVREQKAYAAEIIGGRLTVIDVADKTAPQVINSITYPGALTHNTWLNDAGDICFTTDERNAASVIAWDVSDPMIIQEIDRIRSSLSQGNAAPHNVHVLNDFLITSYYRDGIHITDAQRPHNLVEVGFYDTSPQSFGGFNGCWGAYPFLPSGLILASDTDEGLFVLRPTYTRAAYLEGQVVDALTGFAILDAQISLEETGSLTRTDTSGNFFTGIADSGMFTLTVTRAGYEPFSRELTLTSGELTELTIVMTPLATRAISIQTVDSLNRLPLQNVEVLLRAQSFEIDYPFTTSADGALSSNFIPDSYEIILGKWGYQTRQIELDIIPGEDTSITIALSKGFYDDFFFDFGWQVIGTSETGNWERGVPNGTLLNGETLNPDQDVPDDIGEEAFVTGNQGILFSDGDVDNGPNVLVSPPFDLSDYEQPLLRYAWWMVSIRPSINFETGNDTLRVSLSNGVDTQQVAFHTGPLNNLWQTQEIRITDWLSPTANMRLFFSINDEEPASFTEAGIDHFRIVESAPTPTSLVDDIPGLQIYPNPVSDFLILSQPLNRKNYQWQLYDINGYLLSHGSLNQFTRIPFHYPAGIYMLTITDSTTTYATLIQKNP